MQFSSLYVEADAAAPMIVGLTPASSGKSSDLILQGWPLWTPVSTVPVKMALAVP